MSHFIDVIEISKKFKDNKVFDRFSMNVKENEIFGVVGHNGAGKSTLFKMILSMYLPNEGEIRINAPSFDMKNDIGYLPEQRGLYEKTNVFSQMLGFGLLKGVSKQQLIPEIDYWMNFFKIEQYKNELLGNLSKGNQQKIQFITAVQHNPKLLILDEPFSGLDPVNVDLFIDAVKHMREKGSTVIYSSHEMSSVENLSDRVLFLKNGAMVYLDDIRNIRSQHGKVLKIKNNSLEEEFLIKNNYQYQYNDGIFEIIIDNEKDAEFIANNLSDKYSELFVIESPSFQEIFKKVNSGG